MDSTLPTLQTHTYCYWTLNGLKLEVGFLNLLTTDFKTLKGV